MSRERILITVCTANICRSPMAEALLRHAFAAEAEPLRSLKVVSAGVAARNGEPVSANSVQALKKVGLDISTHRSRPLTLKLASDAVAILCMTESHRQLIQMQFDPCPPNIFLFKEFMPGITDPEIGDPFGGPLRVYEMCRDEMVEAIPSLISRLRPLLSETG